jgi:ABC-type antimicrobial peptide transport system permease subunit
VDRRILSYRSWQFGNFRAPLTILFGGVIVLLLIASCNIASLTLAQVTSRSGELALRRAIGATRWSVARLVLLEIAIVNTVGVALAIGIGGWLLPVLLSIAPATTQDARRRDAGLARRAVRRRLRRPVVADRRASCRRSPRRTPSPAVNASTVAIHRLARSAAMAEGAAHRANRSLGRAAR